MSIVNVYAYRKMLIIDKENNYLLFYFLDYLLSLALINKAFEAKSTYNIKNIFWIKMLLGKQSLMLK